MEKAEAIHIQSNSLTTMGPAAACSFSGCIMPAMDSSGQGFERLTAQLLVDSIPGLIHTAMPDGYLDYFNKPWLEYLGVTLDKVAGWNWTAYIHPEDVERIVAKWRDCLVTGEVFECETRVRNANGEYRWMFHRKVPLRDANGNIVKWYGSSLDIEERKTAEEKLRRSERDLHSIIETIPTMVWSAAPDGFIDFFNPRWLDYTGLSPDQSQDWRWTAAIHPDDLSRLTGAWQSILVSGDPGETEARLRRFDGAYRWFLFRANPLRDESGKIVKWYGTNVDIEDRKRGEEALRARELSWRRIVDNIPGLVATWNPMGEVEFLNRQTMEYFGKTTEELKDWSLIGVVHPDDLPRIMEARKKSIEGGQIYEVEHRCRRADDVYRWFQVRGLPVRDTENKLTAWYLLLTDIDERKRAEEAFRCSEAYLREAQTLSHTGSFGWKLATGEIVWSVETYRIFEYDRAFNPTIDSIVQRVHPADRADFIKVIDGAPGGTTHFEHTYRLLLPDGRVKYVHALAHVVQDASGNHEFVGAVTDVTMAKQAEENVRQSESELRQILDFAPWQVAVLGADGKAMFLNKAGLDYHGLTREAWQTSDPHTLIHPDDHDRILTGAGQAKLLGDQPFEIEARLVRKDGKYRWFLFRFNPLRDGEGRVTRWYVGAADIEDRKQTEERLQNENVALREEIDKASMFEEIVGTSPALQTVLSRISKVAPSDSTVLITGETGTGKELVARAIHRRSERSSRAFVSVNCAATPRDLIASELFGHEKGAFTGATQQRLGKFELANGGTIFLDEVGELPAETQIALLRVLQEHEFERVGGTRLIRADVRVITATNRDLQAAISAGSFRSDLFYRLHVFPIGIPALRERKEDIRLLVEYFIDRYARKAGKNIKRVNKKTLELLQSYPWPGNIRELQNVIERSMILCETEIFSIDENWLAQPPTPTPEPKQQVELPRRLLGQEKDMIEAALKETRGRVSGPAGAAVKLGIPRSTLESKIRSLKISKNRFRPSSGT